MRETPFTRRKEKKPEYEEKPVIRMPNVPAPQPLTEGTPSFSQLKPTDKTHTEDLLQQKTPETVIRAGRQPEGSEVSLFTDRHTQQKQPLPRLTSHPIPPADIQEQPEPTTSKTKLINQITLTPEQAAIWSEAVRPPKNGKNTRRTTDN